MNSDAPRKRGVLPVYSHVRNGFNLVEDVNGFFWLETEQLCTAAASTRALVRRITTFGPPKVWVSDTVTHFKNGLITMLAEVLDVDHHFAVRTRRGPMGRWNGTTGRSSAHM